MTSPVLPEQLRRGILCEGWRHAALSLVLVVAIRGTNLIYATLNHGPNRIFLGTALDASIPLVPLFAIPYVSLIPFIGASLLEMMRLQNCRDQSAALSMITAWCVSYAFYFFLQSYVARPAVTGNGFFSAMVRSIYASDAAYNDFPSLHTSLSMIIAIHWWHIDRRIGIPVAGWTGLIVASTMLVHQHYIADVALGLRLPEESSWLFLRLTRA